MTLVVLCLVLPALILWVVHSALMVFPRYGTERALIHNVWSAFTFRALLVTCVAAVVVFILLAASTSLARGASSISPGTPLCLWGALRFCLFLFLVKNLEVLHDDFFVHLIKSLAILHELVMVRFWICSHIHQVLFYLAWFLLIVCFEE